ncbi:hypothetical protein FB566_1861 [Stackebrandtia endophytica]|uniref:Uncharacterized protein n=1 Tax=Stackebrandtia endophytica TaxID=1496996 RepID=A0A543AUU3_9ACTN|nr:hypothetical protein [Stackebrandtia endophytica]TQL76334.1 hypothetical protein FB566_1861 [Stackebrandtia endophytica]
MESYDSFIFDIRTKYNEIWALAQQKVETEEMTMWSLAGSGAGLLLAGAEFLARDVGYIESVKNQETWEKIENFAVAYCFDYSDTVEAIEEFQDTTGKLAEAAAGINTKIIEGLKEWAAPESKAAESFKRNFVTPIMDIYADQYSEFGRAEIYLSSIGFMVEHNREVLRDVLIQLKKGLEDYEPFILVNIYSVHWGLVGAGLALGPLGGTLTTAADMFITSKTMMQLSGSESGVGTAGIFEKFREGMDTLYRFSEETSDELADRFHAFRLAIPVNKMTFPKPSLYDENGE